MRSALRGGACFDYERHLLENLFLFFEVGLLHYFPVGLDELEVYFVLLFGPVA